MSVAQPLVIHVVAADISFGKLAVLRTLVACGDLGVRQRVVHVGRGHLRLAGPNDRVVHVRAPLDQAWVGARAFRRMLRRLAIERGTPLILHVWSPVALDWVALPAAWRWTLLAEAEPGTDLRRAGRWLNEGVSGSAVGFVGATARTCARLSEYGVPARNCVLIREFVDPVAFGRVDPAGLRERLALGADCKALAVLPPASRASGTFIAAWAALLVGKTREDIRLLVPAAGRERDRVRGLLRSCRHEHVARHLDKGVSLAEVLAAADLAVYTPLADAPVTGLAWAMASGCPLVASRIPAVTELLSDGENAWLCQPNSAHDAARRMLHALERPDESRQQAAAAQKQAARLFDQGRMLAQYGRAYASLAAGRGVADEVNAAVCAD